MSAVTAKMKVTSVEDFGGTDVIVRMFADYADGRNKEWASATPSASFQMTVKREIAETHFPPNRRLTVTFEEDFADG